MKTIAGRRARVSVYLAMLLSVSFLTVTLQGCGGQSQNNANKATLILGGYTTPREAYGKALIPAFQKYWKEKTGKDVEFQESYQGSGAQARAIVGGFEADIAALSLEGDIDKIAEAGLITHDWRSITNRGIVSTSIVVIAVRPGNPKNVKDWADLAQPGVNVLTPDPKTSGGAQWNINALYGAALRGFAGVTKDDKDAAREFLGKVLRNVSIMDKGARESITTFEKGVGDAAITYENEVLVARQAGQSYEYVVPHSTILIENPVALVDKYVDKHGVREVAEAFLKFLFSDEAQQGYVKYGLRPVVQNQSAANSTTQFPSVEDLWKIEYLGGWKKVTTEIYGAQGVFSKVWEDIQKSR
jgi:sulfate/thiosulfate transport system substrate-binding protein